MYLIKLQFICIALNRRYSLIQRISTVYSL